MEKNNKKEYESVQNFIDSIEKYSDEEIYDRLNYILKYLREAHLYDAEEKIKLLAIKKNKNLDVKLELIKKYFFYEFDSTRYCHSWKSVMASIDNLSEEDTIIVLKQLFSHYHFEETSQLLNISNNLKFGIELEYYGISFKEIKEMFENGTMSIIMKSLQIPSYLISLILDNSDFEKENEFDKWIFSKETSDDLPEASSPIMQNTFNCLNQIKTICLLFKALGAQIHGGTGLHINIGADYFKGKIDALKYLLIIWGECEELFFKIANQENDEIRVCADTMSIPIKANIQKTFETNADFVLDTQEDMNRFLYNIQVRKRLTNLLGFSHGNLEIELLDAHTENKKYAIFKKYLAEKSKNDTSIRYTSVNFNHMTWDNSSDGRIEFRLFNSSLDFETIVQNLLLISKLFETSLALANNSENKCQFFNELLNKNVTEEEKLNLLLDLLFDCDTEKEIFKRRWISTKDKSSYRKYYIGKKTFIPNEKARHLKKAL